MRMLLLVPGFLLIGVAACHLVGCGEATVAEPTPVRWMESKPNPVVGTLRVAVIERLGPDRVQIEAHWVGLAGREACRIDLGLPAGVIVVEGEERLDLAPEDAAGQARWILEYPLDAGPLDAVVRYCVPTSEGLRAAQCAVRLTR